MIDFRADLHTHTYFSDGSLSPKELIDLALCCGLKGLSITDHDSIEAYEEALSYAEEKGLLLLSGVEISSIHEKESVHILGYGFSIDSLVMKELCEEQKYRRKERNLAILEKLKKHRMVIEERELEGRGSMGRPHIAALMMKKGYVGTLQEAFNQYLGEGRSCYHEGNFSSVKEVLERLHEAKAKAFLAHPHLFKKRRFVKNILELPFDGMECYYARCHPQEELWCLNMAKERGLLVSGGSDFHGLMKPHNCLGSSWVSEQDFRRIYII